MSLPVVYIDDEPPLCRACEMILGARGFAVVTFSDPDEAVVYLNAHDVAVVFCDFRMANTNGLAVLAKMTRPAPFYLVSGALAADRWAREPGVTGVLSKPFPMEELIEIANRHQT